MKTSNCIQPALVFCCLALIASCSARPDRFVEPDETERQVAEQTQGEETPEIMPLDPLELIDGEPARKILSSIGMTQAFRIGNLSVIHRTTPANSVVSGGLYLIGGVTNLDEDNAGIEKFALSVATRGGTEKTPRDEFNATLDSTGSSVWSFTDRDYSGIGLKTTVEHFDSTWKLFEEAIVSPRLPLSEIELQRDRQLSEIRSRLEDPDDHVSYVATRELFDGHPYLPLHAGTEQNVRSFTRDQLGQYQRKLIDPNRMLLVVVGNIKSDDLIDKVSASLGRLASRDDAALDALPSFASAPSTKIADRDLPTNYILSYFEAPAPGHPHYPAMVVATEYLRDKLFEEVRTRRNLTYAVSAGLSDKRRNYGYVYVTATDPATTMGVIYNTIEEMKLMQIPKAELEEVVNVSLTEHFMGLETNGGQASALANAQITSGDWRLTEAFLPEIREVSPADVQNVARRYFTNFRVGVVGKKSSLNPEDFQP